MRLYEVLSLVSFRIIFPNISYDNRLLSGE